MKMYLIKASYMTYLSTVVEAESLEEAQSIAKDLDGGCYEASVSDDWQVDDVKEV